MTTLKKGKRTEIYCPECKEEGRGAYELVVRVNRENGSQFLGCPNWPVCNYTRPIPESIRMEVMGAQRLPGF
jgi:ssDNA-binding Zn-finger/Zn-ribbon topoisomerase 1